MKSLQLIIVFGLLILIGAESSFAANSMSEARVWSMTMLLQDAEAAVQDNASGFSVGNLWTLTEKAGPLRWPIFIVFVIGVFLVCFKLFELMADKRESRELEDINFRSMNLQQIIRAIASQRESMLSRLQAIMLNVYQSHQAEADLHDEIANYVRFQQDRFDTFRQRVDFLADTAGALGLLGTVWGIFTVFSQGLLDDQVILTGMGVALITTLLGLVVSIVLNLSSTEVFSFFNRRLDRISSKSDELRFRLMELVVVTEDTLIDQPPPDFAVAPAAAIPEKASKPPAPVKEKSTPKGSEPPAEESAEEAPAKALAKAANRAAVPQDAKPIAQVEAVFQDRFSNSSYGDSASAAIRKPLIDSRVEVRPQEPHELHLLNPIREDTVGKKLKNLCLVLLDEEGSPIPERQIEIKVVEGDGLLNDAQQQVLLTTNESGEVRFDWQLSKKVGRQGFAAIVPESDASGTKCSHSILTKPGVPRKLKQFGNNQGGPAGDLLAKPMKVQVLDEFENPISEWPVTFSIELGGGAFDNGKTEIKVKTNAKGEGVASLRVGKDPGFNTVKAAVEGVVKELKFQAMSMA